MLAWLRRLIVSVGIGGIANMTAALRCGGSPPGGRDAYIPWPNEPCFRHSENAIRRQDVRRGNACLSIITTLAITNQLILLT